jgi:hypothetical protein
VTLTGVLQTAAADNGYFVLRPRSASTAVGGGHGPPEPSAQPCDHRIRQRHVPPLPRVLRKIRDLNCVHRCADGRFLYANDGKRVHLWDPDAEAGQWINGTSSFGRYQDIVSTGVYWFTDT